MVISFENTSQNNVDPDQMASRSHLIRIYIVFRSISEFMSNNTGCTSGVVLCGTCTTMYVSYRGLSCGSDSYQSFIEENTVSCCLVRYTTYYIALGSHEQHISFFFCWTPTTNKSLFVILMP